MKIIPNLILQHELLLYLHVLGYSVLEEGALVGQLGIHAEQHTQNSIIL
jgi:hypothetical protein